MRTRPIAGAASQPITAGSDTLPGMRPAVARIDLDALRSNLAVARGLAGGRRVIAVVKADAYGHGAVPVARALLAAGCEELAVVSVEEGAALRDAGIAAPLLVLGGVLDREDAGEVLARHLVPALQDRSHLERLREALRGSPRPRPVPVQVEVDTGMRRLGVPEAEAAALLAEIAADPSFALAGVFTHLARADEADPAPSALQARALGRALAALREAGGSPGVVHVANSAGLLHLPELLRALPDQGAVRPGLLLYGVPPRPEVPELARRLRPVMTLAARVVRVAVLRPGEAVGYGGTFRAAQPTRLATLPVGYGDGLLRSLSNRGAVWIRGALHPLVGRVSMDSVTVDVGAHPVEVGDEAVLFGALPEGARSADRGGRLPVEEVAERGGTIAYELLVRIGPRVPRVFEPAIADRG